MKIGTIGTGAITDRVMCQILEYKENIYEAICTRKIESAEYLAKKYNVSKIYIDLSEMLQDKEVDCVYIASPNSLHYKQAKEAMLAGKNVIVEKPFCSNVKECEELIQICKTTRCFLFEAITTVYNPNYKQLKKEIENIAPLKFVECNLSQYSRKYDDFKIGNNPNVFTPDYSGGALMDLNVYNLHFVIGLLGLPKSISYYANVKNAIDTSGIAILQYDNIQASCIGCKDNIGYNFCQIQGENGYILIDGPSSVTKRVNIYLKNGEKYEFNYQAHQGVHYYYAGEILKMIRNNDYKKCYAQLEHTLNVITVLEAARKDAKIYFKADF